jgi:hypothetical protein
MVSMANPWSDATTAQAAADGAGVGEFVVPVDAEITLGPLNMVTYRYMKGIAQADVEFPAVSMTIRKGVGSDGDDISGDYNGYANTWTQDIGGIQVKCAGNRKGESTKTTWRNGDAVYSICVLGLGGDTDYGLPAEDLERPQERPAPGPDGTSCRDEACVRALPRRMLRGRRRP